MSPSLAKRVGSVVGVRVLLTSNSVSPIVSFGLEHSAELPLSKTFADVPPPVPPREDVTCRLRPGARRRPPPSSLPVPPLVTPPLSPSAKREKRATPPRPGNGKGRARDALDGTDGGGSQDVATTTTTKKKKKTTATTTPPTPSPMMRMRLAAAAAEKKRQEKGGRRRRHE